MRFILQTLLLLLIPVFAFSQRKGDSKVLIDTISFDKVVVTLFENGYDIENKDDKLGLLSTKTKDIGSIGVRVRIIRRDSLFVISGEVVDRALMIVLKSNDPIYSKIVFGGMKGSTRRDSWNELFSISKMLGPIKGFE